MEQQSTSATPSKRQDYVQYNPQLVINYNQQYSYNQEQGLASPSQEHAEDSMLELKDVDTIPSNYSFVSHQIPNNNNLYPIPQQQPMMVQPQQVIYMPAETHQRVYETPSNNNYIHPGMIMNPNVPSGNNHMPTSTSPEASFDMNKYTNWTRVVMIFAIILGIYGCFALVSQLLMLFSYATLPSYVEVGSSVPSIVLSFALSVLEIAAGAVGVWSTVTKNIKHRKYTTITHLVLLSLVVIINIIYGIIGNLQVISDPAIGSYGSSSSSWTLIIVFSILFYIFLIFACCGSCIGCQAYRFRIMSKIQEQPETAQAEGFMVMRDEA